MQDYRNLQFYVLDSRVWLYAILMLSLLTLQFYVLDSPNPSLPRGVYDNNLLQFYVLDSAHKLSLKIVCREKTTLQFYVLDSYGTRGTGPSTFSGTCNSMC